MASERNKKSLFEYNAIWRRGAATAAGVLAITACSSESTPIETPPTSQSASTTSSSNEQVNKEEKYRRDVEIYPISPEAQELKDRITPEKIIESTDAEVIEMFTITNNELGDYSTTEEYVTRWAEQYIILQSELEDIGSVAGDDYSDADTARQLAVKYTRLAAPTMFGKESDSVNTEWYESLAVHSLFDTVDYSGGITPARQRHLSQLVPNSIKIKSETADDVVFRYETEMNSEYDFTDLYMQAVGEPKEVLKSVTYDNTVTLPKVIGSSPITPINFKFGERWRS